MSPIVKKPYGAAKAVTDGFGRLAPTQQESCRNRHSGMDCRNPVPWMVKLGLPMVLAGGDAIILLTIN